jgi:hypothetical protein
MQSQEMKWNADDSLTLAYFLFGVALREVVMLLALGFMLLMVLYHMFPEGWFQAVCWDLREGRRAYNDVFGKKLADKIKIHIVQLD